jgi:hypothetical protein
VGEKKAGLKKMYTLKMLPMIPAIEIARKMVK